MDRRGLLLYFMMRVHFMQMNTRQQHGMHSILRFQTCYADTGYRLECGETILQKKSRGQLIHVSNFINEETGHLVLQDDDGNIMKDAHKIIYPGSTGDAWWDTDQLLAQMATAIEIFNEAHPNCIALFIFDQSSAHASLGPNALHAWNMNKSNGGKQPIQKDTVIPQTNPVVEKQGQLQSMKTQDGLAKGLQQTLEEQGFNTKGMQAKCSPVCSVENLSCCMAHLLSCQDDFVDQTSMLVLATC